MSNKYKRPYFNSISTKAQRANKAIKKASTNHFCYYDEISDYDPEQTKKLFERAGLKWG